MSSHLAKTLSAGQRDSELLLAPVQETTSTQHDRTGGGDLKGKCLHDTQTTGLHKQRGLLFSFHSDKMLRALSHMFSSECPPSSTRHTGPLPPRVHSQCNYRQTNNRQTSQWKQFPLFVYNRCNGIQKEHSLSSRSLPDPGPSAEVRDVVKVPEAFLVFAAENARLPRRCECGHFSGELLVKVTDVFLAADRRHEGRGHFPLQQRLPVHVLTWCIDTRLVKGRHNI